MPPAESAFDENHPYYDPNSSRDKPKWDLVHVQFVRKFSDLITLSELKSFAKTGGALENMQMLKQTRLSVSSVKPREWRFVHGLVEADEVEQEPDEATGVVTHQVVEVSEEVVRKVDGGGAIGGKVNGFDDDSQEEDEIQSKLTTASTIGKTNADTES